MASQEEYWVEREKEHITREQMKDDEIAKGMKEIIMQALRTCIKEIESFYTRYAGKEGISIKDAKIKVNEFDVVEFQETAKRYVKEKNFSDKANKELAKYNTKMRVSRQKLLMMYLNLYLTDMAEQQESQMQERLAQIAVAEVARQAGILGIDISVNPNRIKAMVGQSFYGHTWSTRIWNDMRGLRSELGHVINANMTRGVHPYKFVPKIRERFNVSVSDAKRLLITESARVQTDAQKESYKKITDNNPDAKYKFIAKLDDRTSKTCRKHNNNVYKVSDMMPGKTAPPMHPWCRSSTILIPTWDREKFFAERKGKYNI